MGIGLIVEVMDRAPDGLTSGERLVLLVIAEWANDSTRVARQTQNWTLDTICRRAGIKRSGLKSVLQGLARKGLEVRVPLAVKDGRPVYAHEGKSMTFQVPTMPEWGRCGHPSERGGHSVPTSQEGMPQHPRGVAVASERGGHSHPHPLISPHYPSSLSARDADGSVAIDAEDQERDSDLSQQQPKDPTAAILARHGVTGDNVDQVRGYCDSLPGGDKGPGWYRTCDRAGDLARHIAAALAEPEPPPVSIHRDAHLFEADPTGRFCERCYMPEANSRHRIAA